MTRIAFLIVAALCCLAALPAHSSAARILGFFPTPSKSHLIIHAAIADALAQAGHNVTVVATMPNVNKRARYNFLQIDASNAKFHAFANKMVNEPKPIYQRLGQILGQTTAHANETLMHPRMQQFLRDNGEGAFDLLILGYFMNDFQLGLAAHFNCPVLLSFMIQPIFAINLLVGNPNEISYVPTLMSSLKQPMNFLDRVKNFLATVFEQCALRPLMMYQMQKHYDFHFPSNRYPSFADIRKNVSLILCNHHFSQGPIRPNVPAIVDIGGIQIKEKPDPLPEDIAQALDNAKQGAIYFSLGSNVDGANLSAEKVKIIYGVLSKLPYTVLWKWGDADVPGTANNIIFKSWLPQDDILAHPNVKLFITHGGAGSVVESQYHGVPMVGLPLFADQNSNMADVVKSGFGLSLDYSSLTESALKSAVLEVIANPIYADNVKRFSDLYRDRPMMPRQTAVYWVEYVLRHRGAKHLQSPAVHMNTWQLMSLDVIAFLVIVFVAVVAIFVKLCKFLCCRSKKDGSSVKKNNSTTSKKNK